MKQGTKRPARVVVTGIGMLTAIGANTDDTWRHRLVGRSGIHRLEPGIGSGAGPVMLGANVVPHPLPARVAPKEVRHMPPYIQFALAAADEALQDAHLVEHNVDPRRMGVFLGSVCGGADVTATALETIHTRGPKAVTPRFILYAPISMAAGEISIRYQLKGPQLATSTHGSSGAVAIARACRLIQYGDVDIMLAGATDAALGPTVAAMFSADGTLSQNDNPTQACQPFGASRTGWVLGEGAAMLVLEEYNHARRRGARIYAELAGAGLGADALDPVTPDQFGEGLARAMQNALADAGLDCTDVGLVGCHGESSVAGDLAEANACNRIFANHPVAAFTNKAHLGHTVGASGAIDAALTVLALHHQKTPLMRTPVDHTLVGALQFPRFTQTHLFNVALTNSFGFGMNYVSLAWRRSDSG